MYQLPDLSVWTGRIDPGGDEALRWHQVIQPVNLQEDVPATTQDSSSFAILGFCCDEGVRRNFSRTGAQEGPAAIRKALRNLCVHPESTASILDCGDVICSGEKLEAAQSMLGKKVHQLLEAGHKPLVLGGGHEIAFGHFLGIRPYVSQRRQTLGIINLDAHFDLRQYNDQGNSGTPFLQISDIVKADGGDFHYLVLGVEESANTRDLFNRARTLNVSWCSRDEADTKGADSLLTAIDTFTSHVQALYVTLDLDVINQAYAPGVSAPSSFGWTPQLITRLLERIFSTGKVASFDIAELNPSLDADARTARVAAGFIYQVVKMWR